MKILNMVKRIKEIHKDYIILIKVGNFCHGYGRDSYIISYLFGYNLKLIEGNISECGFPLQSLNKVIAKLEIEKTNYILLDRRNNYETDMQSNNRNLNNYQKIFEKAKIYVNYKRRIDNINKFLIENVEKNDFKEILMNLEEVINERRKI